MCNCKNKCSCSTTDCSCKITLSTNCITLAEDLTCSNILAGQTQTEVMKLLDAYICERFDSVTNFFNLINVGAGSQIYKGVSNLGKKELRTLVDSGLINLVQGTDTITISVDETAMNDFIEANQKTYSALNTGTGAEVYKSTTVVGDNTQFNLRKLKSTDSSVTITQGTDDINITVPFPITPDGSETKIIAGTNGVVTGLGTVLNPYVISSDGGETKINNGTNTTVTGNGTTATPYAINSVNTTYSAGTAMSLVGTTFNNTAPDQIVTLTQGGATTITGTYPNFTISSTNTTADGSETKITAGSNVTVTGVGTIASPYVISSTDLTSILQKLPKNTGSCYPLEVEITSGAISVGGDITAATVSSGSANSVITVTMANAMTDTNYKVVTSFQHLGSGTPASRVFAATFKPISATQFYAIIEEDASIVQNLRVHFDVYQLYFS